MSTGVSRNGRHCRSFYRRLDPIVDENRVLTSILGSSSKLSELILREHIERVNEQKWSNQLAEILSPKNAEKAENGTFFDEFVHMSCFVCISADREEHLKASLPFLPINVSLLNHELVSTFALANRQNI